MRLLLSRNQSDPLRRMTKGKMARRVVITGMGLITPVGVGNDATWSSICEGVGGVSRISSFDPSDLKTQIAGR